MRRPNGAGRALPGTFLHEGWSGLPTLVDRSLRVKAGVRGLHLRDLHAFDEPDRDDRGWLSVAHVDVVRADRLASRFATDTRLVPVRSPGRLPRRPTAGLPASRRRHPVAYVREPDPDRLLDDESTMVPAAAYPYQAVAGQWVCSVVYRFRRAMERHLVRDRHHNHRDPWTTRGAFPTTQTPSCENQESRWHGSPVPNRRRPHTATTATPRYCGERPTRK